jgi:hypothetical protein
MRISVLAEGIWPCKMEKLTQTLNETGTDWREWRLIGKLYVDKGVKVRLD